MRILPEDIKRFYLFDDTDLDEVAKIQSFIDASYDTLFSYVGYKILNEGETIEEIIEVEKDDIDKIPLKKRPLISVDTVKQGATTLSLPIALKKEAGIAIFENYLPLGYLTFTYKAGYTTLPNDLVFSLFEYTIYRINFFENNSFGKRRESINGTETTFETNIPYNVKETWNRYKK